MWQHSHAAAQVVMRIMSASNDWFARGERGEGASDAVACTVKPKTRQRKISDAPDTKETWHSEEESQSRKKESQ